MKKTLLYGFALIGYLAGWWFLDWLSLSRTEGIILAAGGFFWLCQDWYARTRLQKVLTELAAVQDSLKEVRADLHLNQTLLEIGLDSNKCCRKIQR